MVLRGAPLLALVFGAVILVLLCAPARADGIAILRTIVSDNGDDDGFADTNETVQLSLEFRNTTGADLVGAHAILTTNTPELVCLTTSQVYLGDFPDGETTLSPPFVFHVLDVDRAAMGLDAFDLLSASFEIRVFTDGASFPRVVTPTVELDIDIDVSGGASPTTFFESFESETLGAFENDNIDFGLYGLAASDGYRCQYSDPDGANSNTSGGGPWADECHLGASLAHTDATFWSISGPAFSPLGGRAYTGSNSLYFGVDLGPPENWTTPVGVLEAVRSSQPIHLDWSGGPPLLSIKHQVSLLDGRHQPGVDPGTAADRGVVLAQFADDQGEPVGPWLKLYPHANVYDNQNDTNILNCTFDPIDDGNSEDDFFDAGYPHRRYGSSSTCWPEFAFTNVGETSNGFDPGNLGSADGPGLAGQSGIGTWVESPFDLGRFRGRSVRLRFLATALKLDVETYEDRFGFNPDPVDDGWWIDDVTVTQTLLTQASVAIDVTDNSGLPGPAETDGDADGVFDVCDNCPTDGNAGQSDQDRDGLGDDCDPCPRVHLLVLNYDVDGDQICTYDSCPVVYTPDQVCPWDNCPDVYNPDQANGDGDGSGSACDCDDDNSTVWAGAPERNDGLDNNCPGDPGYGLIDELSGMVVFGYFPDPDILSWQNQPFATDYEVASATKADFSMGCTLYQTGNLWALTGGVLPGKIRFYLVRPILPNVGSWGADSRGTERNVSCAP